MLKDILESGNCFKLVCGAGNEDAAEVEKLVSLYSAAGCKFFDLSAKPEIVDAAKRGLQGKEGYLCVSVGIKGDPHIRKAQIDYEKCSGCHKCEEICPQKAILIDGSSPLAAHAKLVYGQMLNTSALRPLLASRCIGCGRCFSVCKHGAISFTEEDLDLKEILLPLINKGIDCIELHAMGENIDDAIEKWTCINEIYDGMLSICTARGHLSEDKMLELIKRTTETGKPYTTIVQADGFPMSGGKDDYKTTLQAVATAEIVQNANLPVYIMLSGGTNSKTAKLAKMCNIDYNGIAIGSFARKIVRQYIERKDFLTNKYIFDEAVSIASNLIKSL